MDSPGCGASASIGPLEGTFGLCAVKIPSTRFGRASVRAGGLRVLGAPMAASRSVRRDPDAAAGPRVGTNGYAILHFGRLRDSLSWNSRGTTAGDLGYLEVARGQSMSLRERRSPLRCRGFRWMERVRGIEPALSAWGGSPRELPGRVSQRWVGDRAGTCRGRRRRVAVSARGCVREMRRDRRC